jgi:hypothetical protein
VDDQRHAWAVLPPDKRPCTHCTRDPEPTVQETLYPLYKRPCTHCTRDPVPTVQETLYPLYKRPCTHCTRDPVQETLYPLYKRLGGHQRRTRCVRKISPLLVFDSRTVQPVAISITLSRPTVELDTDSNYSLQHNLKIKGYLTFRLHCISFCGVIVQRGPSPPGC